MLKKYMNYLYRDVERINELNIQCYLERYRSRFTDKDISLLDVGCWDGKKTLKWASPAGARYIFGLEQDSSAAQQASQLGIELHFDSPEAL